MPAKILNESIDICLVELTNIINSFFQYECFPEKLKITEVFAIFERKGNLDKENYKPVSFLTDISKVFERLMYKQMGYYMNDKLSPPLTGFRKNHKTQHCLLNEEIEKCRNKLYRRKFIAQ